MTQSTISSEQALNAVQTQVDVPTAYRLVTTDLAPQNERDVWRLRYERQDGKNVGLGGEHVTLVVDAITGALLGVTKMDGDLAEGDLPTRDAAQQVAMRFVAEVAPDLEGKLEVLWVEPHSETFQVERQSATLTGMKVKTRQPDGRYAWVIVGAQDTVITFERDIVWNFNMSERTTEKWLHDGWVSARTGA